MTDCMMGEEKAYVRYMDTEIFQGAVKFVGSLIVYGGGSAAVAYALFRFLGKSWLDQHFKKRLEQLKHDQQKQIEFVRHDINSRFSRISKIHEKEFDVLPKAWQLLHYANGAVYELNKAFEEWPDLDALTTPQFEEWLEAQATLPKFKKDELRESTTKLKCYQEWAFWANLSKAKKAQADLNNYLVLNSIFMDDALRRQFTEAKTTMLSIIIDAQYSRMPGGRVSGTVSGITQTDSLQGMLHQIETAVQKRLRYHEA